MGINDHVTDYKSVARVPQVKITTDYTATQLIETTRLFIAYTHKNPDN